MSNSDLVYSEEAHRASEAGLFLTAEFEALSWVSHQKRRGKFCISTPLKVSSSPKAEQTKETSGPASGPSGTEAMMGGVEDISSAHELTAFANTSHL